MRSSCDGLYIDTGRLTFSGARRDIWPWSICSMLTLSDQSPAQQARQAGLPCSQLCRLQPHLMLGNEICRCCACESKQTMQRSGKGFKTMLPKFHHSLWHTQGSAQHTEGQCPLSAGSTTNIFPQLLVEPARMASEHATQGSHCSRAPLACIIIADHALEACKKHTWRTGGKDWPLCRGAKHLLPHPTGTHLSEAPSQLLRVQS